MGFLINQFIDYGTVCDHLSLGSELVCVCVSVCVSVRESKRESKRERDRKKARE